MAYLRTTRGKPAVNTTGSALTHGKPAAEGNFVGVALKQVAKPWSEGYINPLTIANNERYYLITHGTVQVTEPSSGAYSGFAVGDAIYIDDSAMTLTEVATANKPFGRVTEVADTTTHYPAQPLRGVPSGTVRIDLDAKFSAVDAATF